jgi:hypothetical protein
MESCLVDDDFTTCAAKAEVTAFSNPAPSGTAAAYTVTGTSKTGNKFTITKSGTGVFTRNCTTVDTGGCPASGSW